MASTSIAFDPFIQPCARTGTFITNFRNPMNANAVHLADYVCDFGFVVLGDVVSRTINSSNISPFPVTMHLDRVSAQNAALLGLSTNLTRLKALPAKSLDSDSPRPENTSDFSFDIVFDPRGANLKEGPLDSFLSFKAILPLLLLNISQGPVMRVRIKAVICIPKLDCSVDKLNFGEVKIGEAKIITVQLHNTGAIPVSWEFSKPTKKRPKQRKYLRLVNKEEEPKEAPIFELLQTSGSLVPSQKCNLQVKFAPKLSQPVEQRILLKIQFSSARVHFLCSGTGADLVLNFEVEDSPNEVMNFSSILPNGVEEKVVTVTNPCEFPVEMYSLEFDQEYRKEDEILARLEDFDDNGSLLLPVRVPGDTLPLALYDQFNELSNNDKMVKIITEGMEPTGLAAITSRSATGLSNEIRSSCPTQLSSQSKQIIIQHGSEQVPRVSDKEQLTPVTKLLADYLKVDLSDASVFARSRKGLAVLIHKPPVNSQYENDVEQEMSKVTQLLTITLPQTSWPKNWQLVMTESICPSTISYATV
ncbi:hypothetical protein Ciccas_009305 [Cichlidogyrus casuarinus]|uniref:HYDIN/VesB/CFA65-like Ig-like domain-containing protein n=1 Tax=Cichlidogyrus casuarinus TaxID=1844966 RepID=A0ABD2PYV0_9PLAT